MSYGDIVISEEDLEAFAPSRPDIVIEVEDLEEAPAPSPDVAVDLDAPICLYCHSPIQLNESLVRCAQCDGPHHMNCWQELGACSAFGCSCSKYNQE